MAVSVYLNLRCILALTWSLDFAPLNVVIISLGVSQGTSSEKQTAAGLACP